MSKFTKQIKKHHQNKLKYEYQFEKLSQELNLEKKIVCSYNKKKRLVLIRHSLLSSILLLVIGVSFMTGYLIKSESTSNEVPGYRDLTNEKLGSFADLFIGSSIYTEVFSDKAKLIFYIGIEKEGTEPILIFNFQYESTSDKFIIKIDDEEMIINAIDYSYIDENNWDYINVDRCENINVTLTYIDRYNRNFEVNTVLNINRYLDYIEKTN